MSSNGEIITVSKVLLHNEILQVRQELPLVVPKLHGQLLIPLGLPPIHDIVMEILAHSEGMLVVLNDRVPVDDMCLRPLNDKAFSMHSVEQHSPLSLVPTCLSSRRLATAITPLFPPTMLDPPVATGRLVPTRMWITPTTCPSIRPTSSICSTAFTAPSASLCVASRILCSCAPLLSI
jgi:hypothetical protein